MKINEIEFKAPRFFSQEMQSENPFALNNMERTVSPALTVGMSGKVAAFVLFPESNGVTDANQEDWTVGQKNNVIWKILLGLVGQFGSSKPKFEFRIVLAYKSCL